MKRLRTPDERRRVGGMDRSIFPAGKVGSLIDAGPRAAELIKRIVD